MEENRNDDKDMMISEETSTVDPIVQETLSTSDSASTTFTNCVDGTEKPRKSRKGIWIGLLLVVIVLAAVSPFAMALMKKSGLRKNPNLYVLDSLNKTDYTKSFAYETSVKLSDEFKDMIEGQMVYAPVEVKANDVIRFIEGFKLRLTTSDVNYKATGENPVVTAKYDLLFNDKDVFDLMISAGEKGLQMDVAGKKLLFLADLKIANYKGQQKLVDNLKKDKAVQDIFAKLFSKAELVETDIVESKTGQTCDLLKIRVSLRDLYEMVKSFVDIMDTNETVKAFVNGSLEQAVEMQASNGEYDKAQVEFVKNFVQSGMFVPILREMIKENDETVIQAIEQYGVYLNGDLYVNSDGVVRSEMNLEIGEINTMFFDIPNFSIQFNSYRASFPNDVKMSEQTADWVLKEPYTDLRYDMQKVMQTFQKDVIDKVFASPGFVEIRTFLSKFMDVDEIIESMKMSY